LLVNWVNSIRGVAPPIDGVTPLAVGLASGFLILLSFIILLVLRLVLEEKKNISNQKNKPRTKNMPEIRV
jgi:hypothetical protein